MDAITSPPRPANEPVHSYAPGSPERTRLLNELTTQSKRGKRELPHIIGGRLRLGHGEHIDVVQPHAHREVLGFITAGLTNKEIARVLALSPRTVETHRAHLFAKLECESLAQLIRRYAVLVDDAAD